MFQFIQKVDGKLIFRISTLGDFSMVVATTSKIIKGLVTYLSIEVREAQGSPFLILLLHDHAYMRSPLNFR